MAFDKNRKPEELKIQKKDPLFKDSLQKKLSKTRNSRVLRAFSMALAVITVFGTTYGMILPAITVDQESAEEMPGIYLEEESFREADYEDVYVDDGQGENYEDVYADDI